MRILLPRSGAAASVSASASDETLNALDAASNAKGVALAEEGERFRECREGKAQTIANRERYEDRARCHAASDGECDAPTCPQLRDGEPAKTGRHCPIDTWPDETEW